MNFASYFAGFGAVSCFLLLCLCLSVCVCVPDTRPENCGADQQSWCMYVCLFVCAFGSSSSSCASVFVRRMAIIGGGCACVFVKEIRSFS